MRKRTGGGVGRRTFLQSAAATAALVVKPPIVDAQPAAPPRSSAPAPSAAQVASETGPPPARTGAYTVDRPGADFMVDVLKSLGFEYVAANPGSSFRGLHESIINYGGNAKPELLTCCHEESSVAMAHGYAKIDGRPMLVMAHGTVGLQHASMAIYNAWADRVPVYILLGNILDVAYRRSVVEWTHSVQDAVAMVRDYTKWDDTPVSLTHFAASAVRAYKTAMTPARGPVVIVADAVLQEEPIPEAERHGLRVPKLTLAAPPAADPSAIAEAARLLVAADNPVIVAGRCARTPEGIRHLVELAETLQAPVNDRPFRFRMNFPTRHPLYGGGNLAEADVVLGLEVPDFWNATHAQTPVNRTGMEARATTKAGAKLITISSSDLLTKSNYQDFGAYAEVDLAISGDAEASLPALVEACKRIITGDRARVFHERGARIAEATRRSADEALNQAAWGWDASPITTARLSAELWNEIKREDWSLVSDVTFLSFWPTRLWDFDKHYHYIGGQGAYGIGYGAPAAVGAALANRKHGRLSVNIQTDGDLNYAPGVLWTACHHQIPLLTVMHNNRAYHQEVMFVQQMASERNRGADRAHIGTTLREPNIDYAKMAQGYGMYGEGPIENPKDLAPALKRALDRVRRGEPALLDVITQPR